MNDIDDGVQSEIEAARERDGQVKHVETCVPEMRFFGSPIGAFDGDGVLFDIRLKLAVGFLQNGCFPSGEQSYRARAALELAEELLHESMSRGYVKPLPETSELTDGEKRHLERQVNAQVYAQIHGALAARDAQREHGGRVAVPAGPVPPVGGNRNGGPRR